MRRTLRCSSREPESGANHVDAANGARLEVRQVDKKYGGRAVLSQTEITIEPGEFVAIVYRSGCGKGTLLRLVAGLEPVTWGALRIDGDTIDGLREHTCVMLQDSRLLPRRRVFENVALGLPAEQRPRANEVLAQVGLGDRGAGHQRALCRRPLPHHRAQAARRRTRFLYWPDLVDAEWLIAGLRDRVEEEFEEVFSAWGLPSPAVRTRAESMLVLAVLLATTDALVFVPRVWATNPLFRNTLQEIAVTETLSGPEIVPMHSLEFPLTPAVEHLALLLQHAAGKPFQRGA